MKMNEALLERIEKRMLWVNELAAGTVCGDLQLRLDGYDPVREEFIILGKTAPYMRNVIDTLHGGSVAVLADQAMGCIANCLFTDDNHAPTSQLSLNFHRPMTAGEDVLAKVRIVNTSRRQIHLSCEIYQQKAPDKLCASATAIFFRNGKEEPHA